MVESERVSPAPLRYSEARSAAKISELDIEARAPERAEEVMSDCEESGRTVLVPINKSGGCEA